MRQCTAYCCKLSDRSGIPLQWRHNGRFDVSNHRRLDCLLNHLFGRGSKKTPKLRATGLCEWNPRVTGGFPQKGYVTQETFSFDVSLHCCWGACHIKRSDNFSPSLPDSRPYDKTHKAFTTTIWAPFKYPMRRLIARCRKVSKARNRVLKCPHRFAIWLAHRQQCCRCACQISERSYTSI